MTTTEYTVELPPEPASARRGREFARSVVTPWGLEEMLDDIALGITELISNAVRHAKSGVVVTIRRDQQCVTIEVLDHNPAPVQPVANVQEDPYATSGRGLHLVSAISADWGVRRIASGKVVWFSLELPRAGRRNADVFELSDHRPDSAPRSGAGERNAI